MKITVVRAIWMCCEGEGSLLATVEVPVPVTKLVVLEFGYQVLQVPGTFGGGVLPGTRYLWWRGTTRYQVPLVEG